MNTVILPYDPTWQALEWAKEHCPSYITNEAIYDNISDSFANNQYKIIYYFEDTIDVTLFIMRWA